MALITTPGDATVNSYATLEEAETYMNRYQAGQKEKWTELKPADKESALIGATLALDTLDWKAIRSFITQSLAWPRRGMTDRDGFLIHPHVIPLVLKQAQCELAFRMVQSDRMDTGGAFKYYSKTVAGIVKSRESHHLIPETVRTMLAPFLKSGSGLCVVLVRS